MNSDRHVGSDLLRQQYEMRQLQEEFQRIVNEMNSAIANVSPHLKGLVSELYEQGDDDQAKVLDKEFREIIKHKQRLAEAGSLLAIPRPGTKS